MVEKYAALSEEIVEAVRDLDAVYCGFSACIDHLHDLDPVLNALEASNDAGAKAFHTQVMAFAEAGRGGEIEVDWPDGPAFFRGLTPKRALPGGTGVQVANQLALLGARPLLALERRDPALLALLHPNVRLAPIDHAAGTHSAEPVQVGS